MTRLPFFGVEPDRRRLASSASPKCKAAATLSINSRTGKSQVRVRVFIRLP